MSNLQGGRRAYGTFILCLATAIASPAQTFKTLHSFDGTDGAQPNAGLVQATNGNLYGTTSEGGASGAGTVFKITPSGKLTTLYGFCTQSNCSDGANPNAGLVQATDGKLYGTTFVGGANGYGTVFKITPSGKLTTLYSFCTQSNCSDGANAYAGLVQATNGNLYGTTAFGGASSNGTIFKITPSGKLMKLHDFAGTEDGSGPLAGLIQATDGKLYGTTFVGGANGNGTLFKIARSGKLTTLYSFCSQSNCTDGSYPLAGLVQATNANLYGTTSGANGYGTIFKVTPSGKLTTLYSFCSQSNCTDGSYPLAGLVQATNGKLYGTTSEGGANDLGTAFNLSLSARDQAVLK